MKRLAPILAILLLLWGCSAEGSAMDEGLRVRSNLLSGETCDFHCRLTAQYAESTEVFAMDCRMEGEKLSFTVTEPEAISGIAGSVEGRTGALTFDKEILAFDLMADERLSPVSMPWVAIQALKSGYIKACVREDDLIHLSINDTYADDALEAEVWADGQGLPVEAELSWKGCRIGSMTIENFRIS